MLLVSMIMDIFNGFIGNVAWAVFIHNHENLIHRHSTHERVMIRPSNKFVFVIVEMMYPNVNRTSVVYQQYDTLYKYIEK